MRHSIFSIFAIPGWSNVSSVLDIPEEVINESFIRYLKISGAFTDMEIGGNKKGSGTKNVSSYQTQQYPDMNAQIQGRDVVLV